MNRLILSPRHLQTIARHGEATYPEECCGFLLGHPPEAAASAVLVQRVLAAANEKAESRANRFLIEPTTVLAAHREAQSQGLEIVGYYHSHPDHPAVPSEFDREHAWPGMSYLIVPVAERVAGPARSWRLADDRSHFLEEALEG